MELRFQAKSYSTTRPSQAVRSEAKTLIAGKAQSPSLNLKREALKLMARNEKWGSLIPVPTVAWLILLSICAVLSSEDATVAYWRFESGPARANVSHAGADGVFNGTTPDVSGNGNSLSAWTQGGYAGFA